MLFSCSRLQIASLLLALTLPLRAQQADPIVRVYVLSRVAPQSITVRATDGPLTVYANRDNIPVYTLLPGETVTMDRVGDRLRITTPAGAMQASVGEVVPSNGSVVTIRTGTHRRVYHGALSVEIDNGRRTMRLVNYVPLEDYVASVVASEYQFNEMEGVKAQAVLARTYALRAAGNHNFYDLVDDTRAQVYEGAERETDVTRSAAEATRGQVLTYRGDLVEALYYSSSGGHTASNEDIWNTRPLPYLRGRPDPYDSAAPDHRWATSASAGELLRALGSRFGGLVTGFEIARRADSGRALNIRLLGSSPRTVTASQFRSVVTSTFGSRTLRSTHFTAERRGNRYAFNGRGFGHGVGMSQFGAREQARQGRSYRDILSFYFAGTGIDFHDSALVSLPNSLPRARSGVAANTPRRTMPTPRAEAHAASQPEPVRIAQAALPPPTQHATEHASIESGPTWSARAETSGRPRRTAW